MYGAYITPTEQMSTATVYIVGAGPGDPELLTRKAYRLLRMADAVVYDRLVSEDILALVPPGATRIFAGKSCNQHSMTQEEINATLVALTKRKRHIVRLKGGDPFIFGRGGEEADYLRRHKIAYEIIPGITSASGCASYAGIPLTHRGLSSGVRYVTGHRQHDGELNLNWESLADPDTTLVFYMALHTLEDIAAALIRAGLPASTPAALIGEGTTHRQRRIIATLGTLAPLAQEMQPPATLIIGKVVALAERLDWFTPQAQDTDLHREHG